MKFSNYEQEAAIRNLIIDSFDLQEVRTLSVDLGIRYEDLAGETLTTKIRELCALFNRQSRVEELISYCVKVRPKTQWLEIWSSSSLSSQPEQMQTPVTWNSNRDLDKQMDSDDQRLRLYKVLTNWFSADEIEELCFLLNIDWDALRGDDKKAKVRSLIQNLTMRGKLDTLILKVREERPGADL